MSHDTCYTVYTLTILVIFSKGISTGIAQKELNEEHNEFCKPRPTLVAIDSPSFQLFPFFVTLQRCGGSAYYISPVTMTCVANTSVDVKINARNLISYEKETVVEKNHTSCKQQCVNTADMCNPKTQYWEPGRCACSCKYQDSPPEPCPNRFKWDGIRCECRCNVQPHELNCNEQGKIWSGKKCGCECSPSRVTICRRRNKFLDEKTCRCVDGQLILGPRKDDKTCVSKFLLYGIIIGESLVLLVVLDICLCMKGFGFFYVLRKAISRSRKGKQDPPLSPSSHERTTYL